MKMLIVVLSFFTLAAHGKDEKLYAPIKQCLDQYTRGTTVLEIGIDAIHYASSISQQYDTSMVMMSLGKLSRANESAHENLVMLNPHAMTLEMLKTLSRCEHFDVVIVHGIPHRLKKSHELKNLDTQTIDYFFKLGDHLFMELPPSEKQLISYLQKKGAQHVASSGAHLYYASTPKKGIDIARWNQAYLPVEHVPRYLIKSSYAEKCYCKFFLNETREIPWLAGINLQTFVILGGFSPSSESIARQIESMRSIAHNDLIIGNMIVQGQKIVPIDNNDPRWNGNQERLINAALTIFKTDLLRLQDPEAALKRYRKFIDDDKKKKRRKK